MSLKTKDLYEGRKRLKQISKKCKVAARKLLAEEVEGGTESVALKDARSIMMFHFSLKEKNLDAIMLHRRPLVGAEILLVFKNTPRGVPNVLAAPTRPKDNQGIEAELMRMVTAAWVRILETTQRIRTNTVDDLRIFRYQDVMLEVPGEFVDGSARKIPESVSDADRKNIRTQEIERMKRLIGPRGVRDDLFEGMPEQTQIDVMIAASRLLCVEINTLM